MRTKLSLLLSTLAFGLGNAAHAGPFGLEMGMTRDQIETKIGRRGHWHLVPDIWSHNGSMYFSETAPTDHLAFRRYEYFIDEALGLCKVTAIGWTIYDNQSDGANLRSQYKAITEQLEQRYGKPTNTYDLKAKQHYLETFWSADKATAGLPDNIDVVALGVYTEPPNKGYLKLRYEFKNLNECEKNHTKRHSKAL